MPEQVLNKPLSGEEIRQMIVKQVEKMLAGDSRLAAHFAFPACSFSVKVHIDLAHSQLSPVDRETSGVMNENPNTHNYPRIESVDEEISVPELPPNEARVEHDIPVPVLAKDDKGRTVEKRVKYDRASLRKRS